MERLAGDAEQALHLRDAAASGEAGFADHAGLRDGEALLQAGEPFAAC
jgi:hypothetical protein